MHPAPDAAVSNQVRILRQDTVLLVGPWNNGNDAEPPSWDGCTLSLVVAYPGFCTPYHELSDRLHRANIPYSLVLCGLEGSSLAAYFSLEDPTPCWRCLELRYLGWSPQHSAHFNALKHPTAESSAQPDAEEAIMLRWLALEVAGSDPGVARLASADGSYNTHTFLPHPHCLRCSPWAGNKAHDVKRWSVPQLVDDRLGLVRPAASGMESARSTPYAAACAQEDLYSWPACPQADVLRALGRYAASMRAGRPTWRGTRRGVPEAADSPQRWRLSCQPDRFEYHERLELDWFRAHRLEKEGEVAIPADLVFATSPRDTAFNGDLWGVAAHPSLEMAVQLALAHMAELDARTRFPLHPHRVPPQALATPHQQELDEMRRHGMEALVLDVTTDLEVPAAAVLSYGGGNWRAGFGADLDPEVALQRAFGSLRSVDAETLAPHWQRLRTLPQQPMAAMEPLAKTDPIDTWRVHLQRVGRQAAWADITPPDVMASGVVVVRAFLSRPA